MSDTWIVDLRHYLDEEGEIVEHLPGPEHRTVSCFHSVLDERISDCRRSANQRVLSTKTRSCPMPGRNPCRHRLGRRRHTLVLPRMF